MGKSEVNYSLMVGMTPANAIAIAGHVPGTGTDIDKLSSVAAGLLKDLANGGTMVPGPLADRIQRAIGTAEPATIVEHVERSAKRDGESYRVEWIIDPTQVEFYREVASHNNMTLEQHLKALMDYAYCQGWFGTMAPDPFKILLTPEQFRYLQERFGKDVVTGEDVINELRRPEEEAENDLVMDSLVSSGKRK